ncbi:PREDICTED: probable disease resistance protein At5g63020 [Theobroma cacao]|uniref:Probable disease resistance protein At5g63020 n=1 Tax=Theobroma cacao TaxID=3641 RepID=A0AB32WL56_THECC|nr:PREDICTED: probable disease resistance protein At5g63020 [Theobroma cacao]
MGGLCSVSISIENTISFCCNHAAKHASYACRLGKHLDVLETKMEELKALRNDVKRRVEIAERQHMKRLDQVEWWLSRVEALEGEVEDLMKESVNEKKCPGCCYPKNCWASYKLGQKAAEMLKKVRRHRKKGQFERVAETLPPAPGDLKPCEHTVGMESMIATVWNCLSEEQAVIIGLYGMGGIGKTTLLTQINNMLLSLPSNVDFVIWAVASKDLKLEKIQDEIGEKIGYSDNRWRNKRIEQKAIDIYRVLSNRKFVLLLDDLWDRVDLTKIGVPIPDQQNNSKVVFTTRSKEVCGLMEAHKRFRVECLPPPFAWHLFQRKVGNDTLNLHPDIPKLAETVAKECAGLPLALITVGRAMACKKTPKEWIRAIEVLRKCASEFSGMGDKVFPLLKFSFDHLPNEKVRCCFLYCTLFPEDFVIHKTDLIDYWICEELLDEGNDRNGAQNQGYDIIGTLVYACLLEEEGDYVKMHDVIRDMSLWIANECKYFEERFLVQAGVRLVEAPGIKKWETVRRISLMANCVQSLMETPSCPNLLTLFLNENTLNTITNDFFQSMPNLRVLDLSSNSGITELAQGISKLVSLKYLNLSKTSIRQLPNELKSLEKLEYLNLEHTFALNTIPCQLISSFPFLQVLRMFGCGSSDLVVHGNLLSGGNECLVQELQCLKKLSMLSLTVKSASALEGFLSSHKFKSCARDLCLEFLSGSNVLNISCLADMKQLNMLEISDCNSLEELKHDWLQEPRKILTSIDFHSSMILKDRCFNNLQRVSVDNCIRLGDLTWLMLAPNLASLCISRCSQIKEIISTAKCGRLAEVLLGSIKPFEKLEVLHLSYLPELKCIYQDPLPFLSLKKISIFGCPKLTKLPVNVQNAEGHGIAIHGWEFWWKELEWDDETTKNAFVPCFKSMPLNISLQ